MVITPEESEADALPFYKPARNVLLCAQTFPNFQLEFRSGDQLRHKQ